MKDFHPKIADMAMYTFAAFTWLLFETAVLASLNSHQDCSYTLTHASGTVQFPFETRLMSRDGLECFWNLAYPLYHEITFQLFGISQERNCDCTCGKISFIGDDGWRIRELCSKDLPTTFRTVRRIRAIHLKTSSLQNIAHGTIFSYHMRRRKGALIQALNYARARRDSHSELKVKENKEPIGEPSAGHSSNDSVIADGERNRFTRLPVILPAVLTVLIFIGCLIFIAVKMYNVDEFPYNRSMIDVREEEVTNCCPKRNRKKHQQNELYDVMLKEYKEGKHRINPVRKSSTIRIEGFAGNDPQTIAKKHLLLNNLRDPGSGNGAVSTLIKLSSTAFIASSMVRDDKTSTGEPIIEEPEHMTVDEDEKLSAEKDQEVPKNANGITQDTNSPPSQKMEEKVEADRLEVDPSKSLHTETPSDRKTEETGPSSPLHSPNQVSKDQENSGPVWFKYKRLDKQTVVGNDSDDELDYDCAQHIHRILSVSRENIDEARRILPDDVKDIVLPHDLETALAEFEMWPDSTV